MRMGKISRVIKWGITLGKEPQTFLGATWIVSFLKRVPEAKKRIWALRILSMSPHYFLEPENPAYRELNNREYLEAAFLSISYSRADIYKKILKKYLDETFEVLDYGCGPGFLAKATAPHVKKIFAIDISSGAIACAKIVNAAQNIDYIVATQTGLEEIANASLDAVYSFAVVQHLTDEVFEIVLKNCKHKLKSNGQLLLHIQLTDDVWRTEEQWKNDKSVKGKLKYQYGLHCFGRKEEEYVEIVTRNDFDEIKIEKIEDLIQEYSDELRSQRLLTARKKN